MAHPDHGRYDRSGPQPPKPEHLQVRCTWSLEDSERTMATATQTTVKPAHQRATTLAHPARDVETRATPSPVTFAFTPSKIKAPGNRAEPDDLFARVGNDRGREEAFRAALDQHHRVPEASRRGGPRRGSDPFRDLSDVGQIVRALDLRAAANEAAQA